MEALTVLSVREEVVDNTNLDALSKAFLLIFLSLHEIPFLRTVSLLLNHFTGLYIKKCFTDIHI